MRRLIRAGASLCVLAVALTPAACKRDREKLRVETVEETGTQLLAAVNMADPKASPQLVRGFYDVEGGSWRWTMGRFAVTLRAPAPAARARTMLVAHFALPDSVIGRVKQTALSATVNGTALPPETYSRAGEYTFAREVPAAALSRDPVRVEFALSGYLPAGAVETRELGLVMSSIGLESK